MNPKSFFSGALFGALILFAVGAADNPKPCSWEYKVQMRELAYGATGDSAYTKVLNEMATSGWEILCTRRVDFRNVEVVLKRAKE